MVDRGHGGLVEAGLKANAQGANEHQDKEDIAVREGEQHKPQPGERRPDDQHHPDIEPVDEVAHERTFQGGLQFGEREGQRGGGPTEVQLGENGEKIQSEPGVERPALHGVLDAADDHDPPAIEKASRASR